MTRFAVLTLAAALLTAVGATAQTKEIDAEVKRKLEAARQTELGKQLDSERAEDVEVLRRILNQSLGLPNQVTAAPVQFRGHDGYSGQPQFSGQPGGFGGHGIGGLGQGFGGTPQPLNNLNTLYNPFTGVVTQPNIGPFDGVYLAGHGVVFTLHVPEQLGFWLRPPDRAAGLADFCVKCHATEPTSRADLEPASLTGKPASEWDRVRDELQGKKPEAKPQQPAAVSPVTVCEPGKTADRIVTKLANVRHIRHLPDGERVTVVVTFDGPGGSARDRQEIGVGASSGQPQPAAKGSLGKPGFTPEEVQQLTLGDLHLKQNKPREAVGAYERALTRYALTRYKEPLARMAMIAPAGLTNAQLKELGEELKKEVRDAYRRLAQALLAVGDETKAAAALDFARHFEVELTSGPAVKEKTLPVPAKLVVSVAKADLDKAGDDLNALKKAVRIELTGFPPADKKK